MFVECVICGKSRRVRPSAKTKGARFCSIACRSVAYTGSGNPRWSGGRINDGQGRVLVYAPGDPNATVMGGTYAYEYRLIASRQLGRPLRSDEIVHHINGDHTDNRPSNLKVMSQSQHVIEHNLSRLGVKARMERRREV